MTIKCLLLVTIVVGVCATNDVPLNKGNLASELSRARRAPQQANFPGFQNMAPPGFDNTHIVAQNSDSNKNGFAQTTIYKSENGYGSSSVSVSKSGTTTLKTSFSCLLPLLTLLPLVNLFRI